MQAPLPEQKENQSSTKEGPPVITSTQVHPFPQERNRVQVEDQQRQELQREATVLFRSTWTGKVALCVLFCTLFLDILRMATLVMDHHELPFQYFVLKTKHELENSFLFLQKTISDFRNHKEKDNHVGLSDRFQLIDELWDDEFAAELDFDLVAGLIARIIQEQEEECMSRYLDVHQSEVCVISM